MIDKARLGGYDGFSSKEASPHPQNLTAHARAERLWDIARRARRRIRRRTLMPDDWRPSTDRDWTRLRTLLRDVRIHLEGDAEQFEPAEQDLRTIGGDKWSIGIGRYADRAEMCHVLAIWVEDEYRENRANTATYRTRS